MKTIALFALASLIVTSANIPQAEGALTKEDQKAIIDYLKKSKADCISKFKNMTQEQWTFRPNDESWSPAEIAEHILKGEQVTLRRLRSFNEKEYKPELVPTSEAKGKEMITFIIGRTEKFKAPEPVYPTGQFATPKAFIEALNAQRDETIRFVKTVEIPLKAHYEIFGPIGEVNGNHWLLFISAHTDRHLVQLDEVTGDSKFPS